MKRRIGMWNMDGCKLILYFGFGVLDLLLWD